METFYVLLFSYTLKGYPVERTLLLESSEQCNTAIRANEDVATMLGADLFCIDTCQYIPYTSFPEKTLLTLRSSEKP